MERFLKIVDRFENTNTFLWYAYKGWSFNNYVLVEFLIKLTEQLQKLNVGKSLNLNGNAHECVGKRS